MSDLSRTPDPYKILFDPVKIGPVTAPNRFFAVPHATGHSPLMPNGSIAMREMKAKGGWGTVCMQLAETDPTSDICDLPIEKFWDDQDIASHHVLTDRLREQGALSAIELAHTGTHRERPLDCNLNELVGRNPKCSGTRPLAFKSENICG